MLQVSSYVDFSELISEFFHQSNHSPSTFDNHLTTSSSSSSDRHHHGSPHSHSHSSSSGANLVGTIVALSSIGLIIIAIIVILVVGGVILKRRKSSIASDNVYDLMVNEQEL